MSLDDRLSHREKVEYLQLFCNFRKLRKQYKFDNPKYRGGLVSFETLAEFYRKETDYERLRFLFDKAYILKGD